MSKLSNKTPVLGSPMTASDDEERLMIDLFRGYNHLVRPVSNTSSAPLEVQFSLAMVLLISVDEKNQILHTNGLFWIGGPQ
jgi:nicotinic acetylcholine receptor